MGAIIRDSLQGTRKPPLSLSMPSALNRCPDVSGIERAERNAWARIQGGRGEGTRKDGQEAERGQQPQKCHLTASVAETAALESSMTGILAFALLCMLYNSQTCLIDNPSLDLLKCIMHRL